MFQLIVNSPLVSNHTTLIRRLGVVLLVVGVASCIFGGWLIGPLAVGQGISPEQTRLAVINWLSGLIESVGGYYLYAAGKAASRQTDRS
jgi:hypothetical protein